MLDKYNIANGMSSMKRNVILRLCLLFWWKCNEIRTLLGMCFEHFSWKNHWFFLKGRPRTLSAASASFRPNPHGECTLTRTISEERWSFCAFKEGRTIFLKSVIREGIYRWAVRVFYSADSMLFIGAAPEDSLQDCDRRCFGGYHDTYGTWSLGMWRRRTGQECTNMYGIKGYDYPVEETGVPSGSVVAVEADADARTLSFFVSEKKIPHIIVGINPPLHLGISGCYDVEASREDLLHVSAPSFVPLSLWRLPTPSQSRVQCKVHKSW